MALLYAARDEVIERIGSGGVLSVPEARQALDRWKKRAVSMKCDGLTHGAGLSAAIADELAAAIDAAKPAPEAPMKPNLTLVASDAGPTLKAAEASRRAYAQSAEQAYAALDAFARALMLLSAEAAEIADLAALPPGPRERARRLATTLRVETAAFSAPRVGARTFRNTT